MIRFVLADLRRQWAGALAVALLIALATALGVSVTLGERALRLGSARAASAFDLVVGAPGSETQLVLSSVFLQPAPLPLLPGRVLSALRADPRVAVAAPVGFGDFVGDDPVVGTTGDVISSFGGPAEGRLFARLGEAVVGAAVARGIDSRFHPLHGRMSEGGHVHGEVSYRVVGRMAPTGTPWDRAIFVPIEAVWQVHAHEAEAVPPLLAGAKAADAAGTHDALDLDRPIDPAALASPGAPGVPAILVKPRTIADAYKLRQEYRNERSLAVFPAEVLTRLYGTLGDARSVLATIAYGAQALVAGAILLVVTIHVLQRRRQIGALRAFGASRGTVFSIVWLEVVGTIGLGIIGGFALGYGAALALARHVGGASGIRLPVEFRSEDGLALLVLITLTGLVTLLPALLAYRQSPAEALRG
ncbi:membrane protein [Aureimonas endophytica]|uniref:Membrane protein n=1 Tax=Aureimonas endophytica TaxID=2027858 RepID=A0A917ECU5_9HYPH|nr:ABC transporter permease [Aureimonas endophytica]GGE23082.1 membrane protein [Aureimonas endophytica]